MYCGNNKTALASQRQIAEALLHLLDERPYGDISVSAICKQADVSRQTFYSLFQSKENVITFALRNDCCYSGIVAEGGCHYSFQQMCGGFSQYIVGHAGILAILSRHDLMPLLRHVLREDFSLCLASEGQCCQALQPYLIDYLAAGITSIAETYIRTGKTASPEALEGIIYMLLRGEFYPE
ncbi:MAG: TetR family transcriptional regulator [Clostridia bacterium]|nr:TetR family transcriptional regulator [Clostridia bacterium]